MNVLIIGATGTMGEPLVKLLDAEGDHVVAIARKKSRYTDFGDSVEFYVGNAYEKDFIGGVLRKYHYDAIVDFMWRDYKNFTSWFDEMCEATDQYIVLSTSGVYANSKDYITEDSLRYIDNRSVGDSDDEYHIEKARIEDYVRRSGKKNWTIVRPHMIFSESNLRLGVHYADIWLYRALHGLTMIIPEDQLDTITAYTYAGDVAREFKLIIGNEKALGEAYTLTSDDLTTTREVLQLFQNSLKRSGHGMKVKFIDNSDMLCKIIPSAAERIRKDRLVDRKMSAEKIKALSDEKFEFCDWKKKIDECVTIASKRISNDVYQMVHLHAWMDRQCHERIPLGQIRGNKNRIIYIIVRYSPSIYLSLSVMRKVNNIFSGFRRNEK